MSAFDNDVGRDYANAINRAARHVNTQIKERDRLIKLLESAGWVIWESRREEGAIALKNMPIIKSIKRATETILKVDE